MLHNQINHLFIPVLVKNLPTMQLNRQQLSQRFLCVRLVAANVAWSSDEERHARLVSSLLFNSTHPDFFQPQICIQRTLTWVASLEGNNILSFLWS